MVPAMISVVPQSNFGRGQDVENPDVHEIPVAVAVAVPNFDRQDGSPGYFQRLTSSTGVILPGDEFVNLTDRQKRLVGVYRSSRIVRIIATVDILFVAVFGIMNPVFFILIPFPLCGYFGARLWSYRLMYLYAIYLLIESIGGMATLYFLRKVVSFLVIRLVYVLLNVYFFYLVTRLTSFMMAFEDSDYNFLRTHQFIRDLESRRSC